MKIDFSPLNAELELWQKAQLTLPIWWRDDDAVAPTPALDQLIALSQELQIPVRLAVVPEMATLSLARLVAQTDGIIPVVHGWAHQNHSPAGEKKAEFGAGRDLADVTRELQGGMARLRDLFADRLKPMFVPPWNRISPEYFAALNDAGFETLSTYTPRKNRLAAPDLVRINTHLDPIAWHNAKTLIAPQTLIAQLVQLLMDRRLGRADNDEPLGLLTHHLVHDAEIWDFIRQLLVALMAGPVTLYR